MTSVLVFCVSYVVTSALVFAIYVGVTSLVERIFGQR